MEAEVRRKSDVSAGRRTTAAKVDGEEQRRWMEKGRQYGAAVELWYAHSLAVLYPRACGLLVTRLTIIT